jgi:hypothetical protein
MPDWMATVSGYNPLTWASDASRVALSASPDWNFVLVRLGWLAVFLVVSVFLALQAFRKYRKTA